MRTACAPGAPLCWRGRAELKETLKRVWPWYALAFFLVLADQEVKLWVRNALALGERRDLIPHFVELYHVENTGAAFSLFSQHTWILAALSAVVAVSLTVALWKDWLTTNRFSRLCVSLILAGAVGNFIDRAFRGAVTDMFNFTFMTFGIFNVADICVVGGAIGFALYLIAGMLRERREAAEESHDADHPQ